MTISIPGIDTENGIRRAGRRPDLYLRFLARFRDDPSFSELRAALYEGRMDDAYHAAHTLKGLTAQLGINALFEPACELCTLLQNSDANALSAAQRILEDMHPLYDEIVRRIAALS